MQLLKISEHHVYIGGDLEEIKELAQAQGFEITDKSYNLIEGDLPDFRTYKIMTYWLRRGNVVASIRKWSPDLWCVGFPYTLEFVPEPEGGWFVAVREMRGCMSQGDTEEEAKVMIREAMELWIEVSLEDEDLVLDYGDIP